LNTVEGLQPTVESALTDIVAKQSALADLPVGGVTSLVLLDLQNICASIAALGNALLAKSPVRYNSMILSMSCSQQYPLRVI